MESHLSKSLVEEFIRINYPDCLGAFIFGSAAKGGTTQHSDIDVGIVSNKFDTMFIEAVSYNDHVIELVCYPADACVRIMLEEQTGKIYPILIKSLAEAVLLVDTNNVMVNLIRIAKEMYRHGPSTVTKEQVDEFRFLITNICDDLVTSTDWGETIYLIQDLIRQLTVFHLVRSGHWWSHSKWLARCCQQSSPAFYAQMTTTVDACFQAKRPHKLVDLAVQELDAVGGRLRYDYVSYKKPDPTVWVVTDLPSLPGSLLNNHRLLSFLGVLKDRVALEHFFFESKLANEGQIKLYLKALPDTLTAYIQPALQQFYFQAQVSEKVLHFDRYLPNMLRYGGIVGMSFAERYFFITATAVLSEYSFDELSTNAQAMSIACQLQLSLLKAIGLNCATALAFYESLRSDWMYLNGIADPKHLALVLQSQPFIEHFNKVSLPARGFFEDLFSYEHVLEKDTIISEWLNAWTVEVTALVQRIAENYEQKVFSLPNWYLETNRAESIKLWLFYKGFVEAVNTMLGLTPIDTLIQHELITSYLNSNADANELSHQKNLG